MIRVIKGGRLGGAAVAVVGAGEVAGWSAGLDRVRLRVLVACVGWGAVLVVAVSLGSSWPSTGVSGVVPASVGTRLAGRGFGSLPLAARGPVSATLGRAERVFWLRGLSARNPAQGLGARFSAGGVSVSSGRGVVRLSLVGFGREGAVRPVPVSQPSVWANRVVYARGVLREWYANGPLGLEQGFDVARRPAGGSGRLVFAMSLAGDLRASESGGGVSFSGRGVALRYGGVVAVDATGRRLSAAIGLRDGRLVVSVDDRGARYPVRVDPVVQQAALTASNGAAGDYLGTSVAVDGSTIVAGAPDHDTPTVSNPNQDQGAVYVFSEPASGWANATQTAELLASDDTAGAALGSAVAISGGTIVASAPYQVEDTAGDEYGAVYVFSEPASGWANGTQTAELTASDPSTVDHLGLNAGGIAVSGATIVAGEENHTVGANTLQGAAYVFSEPASGWVSGTQTAVLTASDGAASDHFGYSVAVSGGTIVAGSPNHQVGTNDQQGAVYVFSEPASGWVTTTQTAELTTSPGVAGTTLGWQVAISGSTIAAAGGAAEGAYVFAKPARGWVNGIQTAKLAAATGPLGGAIAIDGSTIVAGAAGYKRAYVFSDSAGTWQQTGDEAAPAGDSGSDFGYSVGTAGSTIAVADKGGGALEEQGSVYVSGGGGATPASLTIAGAANVSSKSAANLSLSCAGGTGATCAGRLTLTIVIREKVTRKVKGHGKTVAHSKSLTLGAASYSIKAGTSETVSVKLSTAGKKLFDANHHKLKATASATPSAGRATTKTINLT